MSRWGALWTARLIAATGGLAFALLTLRPRDQPRTLEEVIMMEPFVARPPAAEPVSAAVPAIERPAQGTSSHPGRMEPSGVFQPVTSAPLMIGLDTGRSSYRAWIEALRSGRSGDRARIKIEEWVHAPVYDYALPDRSGESLAVYLDVAVAPWNPTHRLVRVGLKAAPDPVGGRVRQVRAELRFDPAQVRSARRLASGQGTEPEARTEGVDFGPGATFTALYEVSLRMVESGEPMGSLTVSHEQPEGGRWERTELLQDAGVALLASSEDLRFAVAVAGLALKLGGAPEGDLLSPDDLVRWVGHVDEYDAAGRMEFIALVTRTRGDTQRRRRRRQAAPASRLRPEPISR